MNNRYQRMDEFLKRIASIFKENQDRVFSYEDINEIVHNNLISLGTKYSDSDLSLVFSRLRTYFNESRNLETYIDPKNDYYMQFQNNPELHLNNVETIKLYIPQDATNMERSARELFDFLNSSNISHISKISRKERFDDIIVQVTNWNDANTIINFARGNRQIKNGMLDANPFIFSVDNIGLSASRGGSINKVVSSLISTYMNDKIINNNLDSVELLDFINYSRNYYKHHFEDLRDIGEVVSDFDLKGCENNSSENNKKIANVGSLVNLFVKGLYPKFELEDFRKFYLEESNDGKRLGVANAIGLLRHERNTANGSNFVGSIDALLLESVDTFKEKYHIDDEHALKIVDNYLHDGNIQKITRDNDIRKKYLKGDFSNKLNKLLELSGQDLNSYYNNKKNSRAIRSLQDAIFETYNKYEDRYEQGFEQTDGYERATYAVKEIILHNNALGFTRDNNARSNLVKYGNRDVTIEDIFRFSGNTFDINNMNMVNEACRKYVTGVIENKLDTKDFSYSLK